MTKPMPSLPHADELQRLPLRSDEELLTRIRVLVQQALRRQLWFLLLDANDCQLPVVVPMDIPMRPESENPEGPANLAGFIDAIAEASGAASVVIVYERPGPADLRPADLAWTSMLAEVERLAATPLRGVVFVGSRRVRLLHSAGDAAA